MREAIDLLRRHARQCQENAPSDPGTYFEHDLACQLDDEATETDRAADLLEALASPPETVDELERRGQELTGVPLQAGRNEETGLVAAYWEIDGSSEYACGTSDLAAWFAIVGVEVGRGQSSPDGPEQNRWHEARKRLCARIHELEAENARLREEADKWLRQAAFEHRLRMMGHVQHLPPNVYDEVERDYVRGWADDETAERLYPLEAKRGTHG